MSTSTAEFVPASRQEESSAPPPKRRRRRRQQQSKTAAAQLTRRKERLARSPIRPVSRAHPVGERPIHEFRTTGQIAQALRITRNRVHELAREGRLTPAPVRMGIDTYLFHKTTSYRRRVPGWVDDGPIVSAEGGEK